MTMFVRRIAGSRGEVLVDGYSVSSLQYPVYGVLIVILITGIIVRSIIIGDLWLNLSCAQTGAACDGVKDQIRNI